MSSFDVSRSTGLTRRELDGAGDATIERPAIQGTIAATTPRSHASAR